jgi:hypothetical protein
VLMALRVPGVDVHDVIQAHRRQVVELMHARASELNRPEPSSTYTER